MNATANHKSGTPGFLFEVYPDGDPYSCGVWVREYRHSFDDETCIFRGDLSGSRSVVTAYLRRNYPGCKIRQTR